MKRKMPSQEEQDAVIWYVLTRPLIRPNTSYKKAVFYILFFLLSNIVMTILLYYLFEWLGTSSFLPENIVRFNRTHHTVVIVLLPLFQFMFGGIIAMKRAVIGAIHLYQRYAPEDIRRRCLFKPTCSEYAILAVQKYGVIRGLWKAYNRLFKRCRGRIYMIDEP